MHEAVQSLEELVREAPPGSRLPPIRKLMADLGVSLVTLNTALAALESRGLLERRRGSGLYALRPLGPLACLLINPRILLRYGTSPFYPLLVAALQSESEKAGIRLSLHCAQHEEEDQTNFNPKATFDKGLLRAIEGGVFQGALGLGLFDGQVSVLEEAGVPSAGYAGGGSWVVHTHVGAMAREGVDWLWEEGVEEAEIWADAGFHEERIMAAVEGCQARIKYIGHEGGELIGSWAATPQAALGILHGTERLSRPDRPRGLVLVDDAYAQGILMAMHRLGLSPETDVRIATLCIVGSPALWAWEPWIHCMPQDPSLVARAMVQLLALELGLRSEPPVPGEGMMIERGQII